MYRVPILLHAFYVLIQSQWIGLEKFFWVGAPTHFSNASFAAHEKGCLFSYLDFARAYGLPQRPCLETDSMADFRLTDPIQPEIMEEEFSERCRRWMEAKRKNS